MAVKRLILAKGSSMDTQLIAISEVARRLGVSHFTVRRFVSRGDIVTVNVGARRLIPLTEIDRIVQTGVGQARPSKGSGSAAKSVKVRM